MWHLHSRYTLQTIVILLLGTQLVMSAVPNCIRGAHNNGEISCENADLSTVPPDVIDRYYTEKGIQVRSS